MMRPNEAHVDGEGRALLFVLGALGRGYYAVWVLGRLLPIPLVRVLEQEVGFK